VQEQKQIPSGMTTRKAKARVRASAGTEADPFGMTTRKAKARATATDNKKNKGKERNEKR
jgi:hypothetical protein